MKRIAILIEADDDRITVRDLMSGEERVCLEWQDESRAAIRDYCRGIFESALCESERSYLAVDDG